MQQPTLFASNLSASSVFKSAMSKTDPITKVTYGLFDSKFQKVKRKIEQAKYIRHALSLEAIKPKRFAYADLMDDIKKDHHKFW